MRSAQTKDKDNAYHKCGKHSQNQRREVTELQEFQAEIARARDREIERMREYSVELDRRLHRLRVETRYSNAIKQADHAALTNHFEDQP